ncbi:hypothetical protein SASPL_129780 [Salvia splendens]|uniref:Uncharacterized protein n=1 Tax=Salvia splendens TaxID=180675 RepID=A0A8X8XDC4_SALSN|nr:hypothetical protein SASPL_129780 [Salvia splendens]
MGCLHALAIAPTEVWAAAVHKPADQRKSLQPPQPPSCSTPPVTLSSPSSKRFSEESGFKEYAFFSVRKSSMIQFKTKLDMSMVANSKEDHCDFRIEGSWFERSCAIYTRDTNNDIAQQTNGCSKTVVLIEASRLGETNCCIGRTSEKPLFNNSYK